MPYDYSFSLYDSPNVHVGSPKALDEDKSEFLDKLEMVRFNQRFDERVKLDQLDLNSVETVVDEKVEDKLMLGKGICL
ncbi:hypothetical protein FXO38_04971 [Capsicum annuum]|nr:hypothetical protein FXO37_06722 [Capsicum annuum]KAF3674963.1 hypothetical protein FXO38_04971 [Capsicum annuum]